jgi:DNA-binding transcriptional MerR regulator
MLATVVTDGEVARPMRRIRGIVLPVGDEGLVSSGVAAKQLGVDISALSRWVKEGKVVPAQRTVGGHYRWDMAQLRRQLKASDERAVRDQLRAALSGVQLVIAEADDPHRAIALVAVVLAVLQDMADDMKATRQALVKQVYEDEELALAPLADEIDISAARAARRERET